MFCRGKVKFCCGKVKFCRGKVCFAVEKYVLRRKSKVLP